MQTVNTGSLAWGTGLVLGYFYMVMSWGGYSFIINLLPIYCLACVVTGRLSARLYVAFAPLIVIGTLGAGVCFVSFCCYRRGNAQPLVRPLLHGQACLGYAAGHTYHTGLASCVRGHERVGHL
jgi:hypothetical protein